MNKRSTRQWTCALAAVAMLAAGCSSDSSDSGDSTTSDPAPTEAASTAAETTTVKQPGVTIPTKVPNVSAKRDLVNITKCQATKQGWVASGTASGRPGAATPLQITVFFTTDEATVVHFGRAKINVPAGGERNWTVSKKFPVKGNINCLLRGVA